MGFEIERKYIVKGNYSKYLSSSHSIKQGFLSVDNDRVVRIRSFDDKGYITVKGRLKGLTRFEWDKEITKKEADDLIELCLPFLIEKTRHIIIYKKQRIEVDEFHGRNSGLILAEIELDSETTVPELPDWIGEEVTDDTRYYHSYLSQNPFTSWDK
ncbi:MAG TPA: CYTH domain-containing protein [Bacteroidales bacterium]|nr:CYTH domain-containing protein [Bacteroidales bacterium]